MRNRAILLLCGLCLAAAGVSADIFRTGLEFVPRYAWHLNAFCVSSIAGDPWWPLGQQASSVADRRCTAHLRCTLYNLAGLHAYSAKSPAYPTFTFRQLSRKLAWGQIAARETRMRLRMG